MGRLILLNKPYRVLCQFEDEKGRATLADYVPLPDIYPAGRLDYESEGLVLLTDVGWLQHWITHPRHKLPKVYWVQVEGIPTPEALQQLAQGVVARGERTRRSGNARAFPQAGWRSPSPRAVNGRCAI